MAGNAALDQLSKKPLQVKLGALAALLLVPGLLYYQFYYTSLDDDKVAAEQQLNSLLQAQSKLDTEIAERNKLAKESEELERKNRDNMRALPTEAELPAFFDHLQRKADETGIKIRSLVRKPEEEVDIYVRIPVEMQVSGSFHGLMHYFSLLGPQQNAKASITQDSDGKENAPRVDERIVSIADLSLSEPSVADGQVVLTAKFTAATFRLNVKKEAESKNPAQPSKPGAQGAAGQAAAKVQAAADKREGAADKKAAAAAAE